MTESAPGRRRPEPRFVAGSAISYITTLRAARAARAEARTPTLAEDTGIEPGKPHLADPAGPPIQTADEGGDQDHQPNADGTSSSHEASATAPPHEPIVASTKADQTVPDGEVSAEGTVEPIPAGPDTPLETRPRAIQVLPTVETERVAPAPDSAADRLRAAAPAPAAAPARTGRSKNLDRGSRAGGSLPYLSEAQTGSIKVAAQEDALVASTAFPSPVGQPDIAVDLPAPADPPPQPPESGPDDGSPIAADAGDPSPATADNDFVANSAHAVTRPSDTRALDERSAATTRHDDVLVPTDGPGDDLSTAEPAHPQAPPRAADTCLDGAGSSNNESGQTAASAASEPVPPAPQHTSPQSRQVQGTAPAANPDLKGDLHRLPGAGVGVIWMLQQCGIHSIRELAAADIDDVQRRLGLVGQLIDLRGWLARVSADRSDTAA